MNNKMSIPRDTLPHISIAIKSLVVINIIISFYYNGIAGVR
jgi:hypothetical protein